MAASAEAHALERAASAAVELSIVVPMRNEAPIIDALFARLAPVLARLRMSYEVICIDDGSTDATLEQLLRTRAPYLSIRVLSLLRNFVKDDALSAGLVHL